MYFLTHLKSFRTNNLNNLIKKDADFFVLNVSYKEKQGISNVSALYSDKGKKIKIDEKYLKSTSEYFRDYFSFVFSPDHLFQFKNMPATRRYYFDRLIGISRPDYLKNLKKYKKIQTQKNILLKNRDSKGLDIWNGVLAEVIVGIDGEKKRFVDVFNGYLKDLPFQLGYDPSVDCDNGDADKVTDFLAKKKERELATGHMLYGPHRDNMDLKSGKSPCRDICSNGEYKKMFLDVIFFSNKYLQDKFSINSIVLLDDIFSEFDQENISCLVDEIGKTGNQIFMTGLEKRDIPGCKFFKVDNNNLTETNHYGR